MLKQRKHKMNILDLFKSTRTETGVKPESKLEVSSIRVERYSGNIPDLSQELKEMLLRKERSLESDDEYFNDFIYDPPTFEELFPIGRSKLQEDIKKMFNAALEVQFDLDTKAAMIEVASTYFINMVLFDYGIMPDRPNFIYCYLHNVKYISEEDYERFNNKEILKTLEMLIELNCYYLSICYEFTKEGNDYSYVNEFNITKYITTACALVEKIVTLLY